MLTGCLSPPSLVLPHGLGVGVTGVAASLVPGGRPRYGATDCRTELVRALGALGRLAPNVGASRLPAAGPVGLTGRERCSLKVGLAQALPARTQNQGCLKEWADCRKIGFHYVSGWPGSYRRWRLCPLNEWTATGPAQSLCPGLTWGWRSVSHWTVDQSENFCQRWENGSSLAPSSALNGSWDDGCSPQLRLAPSSCPHDSTEGEKQSRFLVLPLLSPLGTVGPRAQGGSQKQYLLRASNMLRIFTGIILFNP